MTLLLKKICLLLLPILLLGTCFVITDPFKNIFRYTYYNSTYMLLSRGDISTRIYLQNRAKYHYNSFIFGSSRSCSHTCKEWSRYLRSADHPYSFGAWNENIEGISKRVSLIDSLQDTIRNAFVLLDTDHAFKKNGAMVSDHYLISGISRFNYYKKDIDYYFKHPKLILTSIDYTLFHRRRAYMNDFIGNGPEDQDPVTNDWEPYSEDSIRQDSVAYYRAASGKFYDRTLIQQFAPRQINARNKSCLLKMVAVFQKHHTNVKVVVAPLYDQVKINTADLALLKEIFGPGNVFDYSGINAITANKFNFGNDVIHYRKKAGDLIFREIYR